MEMIQVGTGTPPSADTNIMSKTKLIKLAVLAAVMLFGAALRPAHALEEYLLTPGDVIKVSVFKNPDLMLDARVSEAGTIGFPLLGSVPDHRNDQARQRAIFLRPPEFDR